MTGTTPIDTIIQGDCLEEMGKLPDKSIDAIVTDPPAGINFMQKSWDGDKGGRNQWIAWMKDIAGECLRVIKPGGHALVWALPRTSHWTGMAWEEAGWEPRDKISHVFGSGFPKSLDIGKAIDRSIFTTKTSNPDFQIVRAWVRGKVKAAGLTYKQIDTALGNANSHKASHYLDNSQPQLPTPEDWEIIKNMLHLDESVDINRPPKLLVETFEREIIGYRKCHAGLAFTSEGPTELPITKPMSKEAEQWAGWGSSLKPAHEDWWLFRAPLDGCTIAENVLRWGCGGLNVDGCRINPGEIVPGGGRSYGACDGVNEGWKRPSHADYESKPPHTAGRFPSNLIHDASPVVLAEFAKAGMTTRADKRTCKIQRTPRNDGTGTIYGKDTNLDPQPCYGDVGSAARFFQSCPFQEEDYGAISPFVYYAKSSRSERNLGLDRTCTVKLITDNDLIEDLCLNKNDANMAAAQLLQKVTSGLTVKWSIAESGESIMALCPWGSLSTTLTEINKIIESRILPSLMHSLINESIQDVNSSKEFGGNRAVIVEQLKTWILTITNEKTELALGASRVALKMLSQTSAKESWQDLTNFHSTVKPLSLMRYLCRLITPPGGIILDPFGGSGTTGMAAIKEGFHYILIEKEPGYCEIARKRVAAVPARLDRWAEADA